MGPTTKRFKCDGGLERPVCTVCSKGYGQRLTDTTITFVPDGQPIEPYRGNQMLVEETTWPGMHRAPHGRGTRVERKTWNGRWFGGYAPFCTLQCALAFARAAHDDGARYKIKAEA